MKGLNNISRIGFCVAVALSWGVMFSTSCEASGLGRLARGGATAQKAAAEKAEAERQAKADAEKLAAERVEQARRQREARRREQLRQEEALQAQWDREEQQRLQASADLDAANRQAAIARKKQTSQPRPADPTAQSRQYEAGQSLASSLNVEKPVNPNIVPGYAGTNLSQSHLTSHDLAGLSAASAQVKSNEAGSLIVDTYQERDKFQLDPQTDPLFRQADQVVADPSKIIQQKIINEVEEGQAPDEIKTCEEAGEETLEECEEMRIVTVKKPQRHKTYVVITPRYASAHLGMGMNIVTGQKWTSYDSFPLFDCILADPLPSHLQAHVKTVQFAPDYYPVLPMSLSTDGILDIPVKLWSWGQFKIPIEITLVPAEKDVTERIADGCEWLEERVEKGLCAYEEIQLIEGPATRIINEFPVKRDWWRRKKIYRCRYPALNDCEALRAKGCFQINSACKQMVGKTCVVWKQTYQCPSLKRYGKSYRAQGTGTPFCLSGNCADTRYEANGDFLEVMSKLSVFKQAQDDLRAFGGIFKGQDRRCSRNCISFRDCCGNGKGWGVSLGLASCDAQEKELAELRKKNRCLQVATYCAERDPILKICLRKKTTFCCYSSKLARMIQEQGRSQLGLGLGSPEYPSCEGLSPEQLTRLDFSRMNFSELFSDVALKTKVPDVQGLAKGIQKSMADKVGVMKPVNPATLRARGSQPLTKGQKPSAPGRIQGRTQGDF